MTISQYLYAGKNAEAYAEAKKIIDEESKTGYFKASTNSTGFRNGNMKMYNDIIVGLYSPKELVEWDQEINHATDGDSQESYLCLDYDEAIDYIRKITKQRQFIWDGSVYESINSFCRMKSISVSSVRDKARKKGMSLFRNL